MSYMPWYGELPERWEIHRLKTLVTDSNIKASPHNRFYIGLENISSWTACYIKTELQADGESKEFIIDDVIFGKLRPYLAKAYVPMQDGVCSGEFLVLRGYRGNPIYLKYLLLTAEFIMLVHASTYSAKMPRANWQFIGNCIVPFPPRNEQDQIVRYLDWKVSQINKLINAKRRQIKLLQEQKRSFLNKTVTIGINPKAKMKNTDFSWLRTIPSDWSVRPFSKIAKVCSCLVSPDDYSDSPQISPANIEKDTGKLGSYQTVREAGIISNNHRFHEGQIIYSKIRPLLNKVTIAPFDGLCSADMYPIETNLITKYLVYFILSDTFLSQLTMTGNRVKMPKINQKELSGISILCPPTEEQSTIVSYLDNEFDRIDVIISKLNDEINLFVEYRIRLISDVVTGKLDVRSVVVPDHEAVGDAVNDEDMEVIEEVEDGDE
jgi:type I restriction enzyme S subunit